MPDRPTFVKPAAVPVPNTPEELFYHLSGRTKSHSYLRGPQQDVLRAFVSSQYQNERDIAFELPTGSGKTTVGLLIAECHRRKTKNRAAFLTLTNQLAAQVIEEAKSLSIEVADLRGNRDRRSPIEEGKFLNGSAIAVTTYSNLFNVNPVVNGCDLLVFDDAHGGGDVAAAMWTMRISAEDYAATYIGLLATLQNLMTETQRATLADATKAQRVELVDLNLDPAVRDQFIHLVDELPNDAQPRFAWRLIRPRLHACHVYVTPDDIVVRPFLSPTFSHGPFEEPTKRIYLSATLGDIEDLKRAYALEKIVPIRAAQKQDGRRFIFAPGLAMGEDQIWEALAMAWPRIEPRRAVAISPSFRSLNNLTQEMTHALRHQPGIAVFSANDVEESLQPFTSRDNSILALANRYDGLDLPDDDCRLLILSDSPKTTNELETNLSIAWKSGPALRWREATRLAQGMGRCTRNATDYAIILLVQESLNNTLTNSNTLKLLPRSIQAEIQWGRDQLTTLRLGPDAFAEMVVGLITDDEYRKQAEEIISQMESVAPSEVPLPPVSVATFEVGFSRALWNGNYTRASEVAKTIADTLSGQEWAGYRSWWSYLGSLAARLSNNLQAELDCIRRAKSTEINSGWLDHLFRLRAAEKDKAVAEQSNPTLITAEQIWTHLDNLGWSGPRFLNFREDMRVKIGNVGNHKLFHQGVGSLGQLLGATVTLPGQDGDPDVIWRFGDNVWVCFEAKSEKDVDGSGLSKKDLLQAKGHVDWVRFFHVAEARKPQIVAVITAPIEKLHSAAEPHRGNLYFVSTSALLDWCITVAQALLEIRAKYVGHEFSVAKDEFLQDIARLNIDLSSTLSRIKATPLQVQGGG